MTCYIGTTAILTKNSCKFFT